MDESNMAGDRIEVNRDSSGQIQSARQETNPDLPSLTAHDHTWAFTYVGPTIRAIHDNDGVDVGYSYDADGFLTDVEGDGHREHYDYDPAHHATRVIEDGSTLQIHYDAEGRADMIDLPDHSAYHMRYSGEGVDVSGPTGDYSVRITGFYVHLEEHPAGSLKPAN